MKLPKNTQSSLLGGWWDVGDPHGAITLVEATSAHGKIADDQWERDGRRGAWSWSAAIVASCPHDRFAIVSASGELLALASSRCRRLLNPQHGLSYRLDFFEVAPRLVGEGFGYFVFAIGPASRALELGAANLLLASVEEAVESYKRSGGQTLGKRACQAYNWKAARGLIPFHFADGVLTDRRGDADGWKKT